MEFLPVVPASPTRRRSRNESFPIRNERANQTFSCCTVSRGGEGVGAQWTVYLCLRLSRKSLSLAVFCLPFVAHSRPLGFLASDSLVRSLPYVFFPLLINVILRRQPENRLEKCIDFPVSISIIRLRSTEKRTLENVILLS